MGLAPFRGRYLHDVPLTGWRADSGHVQLGGGAAAWRGNTGDAAVLWSPRGLDRVSLDAPLVFAGYGITAPEYDWNDYPGDVRGRTVLVLAGDPPTPRDRPALFDGGALTWYGRWAYKVEEAARRGAAAVLLVHDPAATGYDWDVVRSSWGGEVLTLAEDSAASPPVVGWIQGPAARALLARAGASLDSLAARAGRPDFEAVTVAPSVRVQLHGQVRRFTSPNVAAVLPGSHRTRRAEHVVLTAHFDHFGIGPARAGDSIYNGAYDNASGVAALLEVAAAFAGMAARPDRSLVFLASTAEEAGMLGATHFVRHHAAGDAFVAALNLDGANLWGETDDVGGVGAERSSLGLTLARAAARLGMRAVPERSPAQGFYFRSDHFPFARAGVPALSLEHGLEYRGREPAWGPRVVGEYLARHYHGPGDEVRADFDLRGAVQQARVTFLTGLMVAGQAERPAWFDGGRPPGPPQPAGAKRP